MATLGFIFTMRLEPYREEPGFEEVEVALEAVHHFLRAVSAAVPEDEDARPRVLSLDHVHFGSPLHIAGMIKNITSETADRLSRLGMGILNRVLYHDLERKKRQLDIASTMRDVRRKDIENAKLTLEVMRELKAELGTTDTAELLAAVKTLSSPSIRVEEFQIGELEENTTTVPPENK